MEDQDKDLIEKQSMLPEIKQDDGVAAPQSVLDRLDAIEARLTPDDAVEAQEQRVSAEIGGIREALIDTNRRLSEVESGGTTAATVKIPIEGVTEYVDPYAEEPAAAKAIAKMGISTYTDADPRVVLEMDTVVRETDATVLDADIGAGAIVVKKAGDYIVGCHGAMEAGISTTVALLRFDYELALVKNGSSVDSGGMYAIHNGGASNDETRWSGSLSTTLECIVGDVLSVRVYAWPSGIVTSTAKLWAVEI